MSTLKQNGYAIHSQLFTAAEIDLLREEFERVAGDAGSACVRHACARSAVFQRLAGDPRITALIPDGLNLVRSLLFDKTPAENWPVPWHQDLTICVESKTEVAGYGPWSFKDGAVHVQAPARLLQEMVTARIHLDDTSSRNGALRVIPKSHTLGKIPSSAVKDHIDDSEVTCECLPGDVLLMCPLLLHASGRATPPKRRRVIHFEFARLSDLDPCLSWNEAVRPTGLRNP